MAVLLIDSKVKADIAKAMHLARKRVVPLDYIRRVAFDNQGAASMKLGDRQPGYSRPPEYRSQQVLIPVGYRAAVSYEEQPAGIALHLSISVERADPKWMPSPQSVTAIAAEFGIDETMLQAEAAAIWTEEYEPGRFAVNMLVIKEPKQEGHA